MAVAVYLVGLPINNDLIKVIIQIVTGLVLFPLISFVTKNDSFNYVLSMIKSRKNRE